MTARPEPLRQGWAIGGSQRKAWKPRLACPLAASESPVRGPLFARGHSVEVRPGRPETRPQKPAAVTLPVTFYVGYEVSGNLGGGRSVTKGARPIITTTRAKTKKYYIVLASNPGQEYFELPHFDFGETAGEGFGAINVGIGGGEIRGDYGFARSFRQPRTCRRHFHAK